MVWSGKIIAFRKKYALTQAQLADAIGADERVVRRWERGDAQPAPEYVLLLRQLMVRHGAHDIAEKQVLQCNGVACVFALPLKTEPSMLATDRLPTPGSANDACSGLCHLVQDQVMSRFGHFAKEVDAQRLRAEFTMKDKGENARIKIDYHFLRTFSSPMMIAEWSATAAQGADENPEQVEVTRI